MAKKKYNYRTINMPRTLVDKIKEVLASEKHGFTSIPDFVKVAIRKYLRELGYIK
ncbi:unnamed protein product [marine sediment metagenome]|uniref:Ribbon-helix-helix protein CopG domain-containing protein n=1 Tax=marine sediment metagenome TaxID=412755 RepID=X1IKW5_9ZZZZ